VKNVTFPQHSRAPRCTRRTPNRLSSTQLSLAYTHRLFQMAADYLFRDLLQTRARAPALHP
jgi:hypothetical protein